MEELEVIEIKEQEIPEVIEDTPVEDQEQTDVNELLIEYIKTQLEEEAEEQEEETEETPENNIETVETEVINPQIGEILEELRSSESNLEYQSIMLDDYNDNNNLASDMTTISLTNQLLILIYMSILFTALLNFSRRIF